MNFLHIEHINDLMLFIKDKPEFKVMKQENGTNVISYIIATDESFDNEGAMECRGITFDADGKILIRAMHKFFNVNERESTQVNVIPWNQVTRIMDKRDGSMINTCVLNDKVCVKTKKSFTSDVAKIAQVWFDGHQNYLDFARDMAMINYSPVFEYTSPSNRIVLPYETDEMTLLNVRHNFTGNYLNQMQLEELASKYNVVLVQSGLTIDINDVINSSKDVKGIEGWVIQFVDGDMVKLKTEEYLISHRLITFVRERDIAEMVLNENLDDVKSAMMARNISLDKLHAVEHRVLTILREMEKEVETVYEGYKQLDRKSFVEVALKYPTFSLMMQRYSGNEPDYVKFFKARILKEQFDLTSV